MLHSTLTKHAPAPHLAPLPAGNEVQDVVVGIIIPRQGIQLRGVTRHAMNGYDQILPWHPMTPCDRQITNGKQLIELISNRHWAPHICNFESHGRVLGGTPRGEGKIHPVICMGVLGAWPHATNLHGRGVVNEWTSCTAKDQTFSPSQRTTRECGTSKWGPKRVSPCRCKLHTGDLAPVVGVVFWDYEGSTSSDVVCCTVVVII